MLSLPETCFLLGNHSRNTCVVTPCSHIPSHRNLLLLIPGTLENRRWTEGSKHALVLCVLITAILPNGPTAAVQNRERQEQSSPSQRPGMEPPLGLGYRSLACGLALFCWLGISRRFWVQKHFKYRLNASQSAIRVVFCCCWRQKSRLPSSELYGGGHCTPEPKDCMLQEAKRALPGFHRIPFSCPWSPALSGMLQITASLDLLIFRIRYWGMGEADRVHFKHSILRQDV